MAPASFPHSPAPAVIHDRVPHRAGFESCPSPSCIASYCNTWTIKGMVACRCRFVAAIRKVLKDGQKNASNSDFSPSSDVFKNIEKRHLKSFGFPSQQSHHRTMSFAGKSASSGSNNQSNPQAQTSQWVPSSLGIVVLSPYGDTTQETYLQAHLNNIHPNYTPRPSGSKPASG